MPKTFPLLKGKLKVLSSTDILMSTPEKQLVQLLDQCPNLKKVSMTQSSFFFRITASHLSLFSRHNIQLIRVKPPYQSSGEPRPDIQDKRDFFEKVMNNPDYLYLYQLIRKVDYIAWKLCDLLFVNKSASSIREAAQKVGMNYRAAQTHIGGVLSFFGYETQTQPHVSKARALSNRIRKAAREAERRAHKESCKYKGEYPPVELPRREWVMWKKVNQHIARRKNALAELSEREKFIIIHYFFLSGAESRWSVRQLGKKFCLAHQRIDAIKMQVLRKWNLLEVEEAVNA